MWAIQAAGFHKICDFAVYLVKYAEVGVAISQDDTEVMKADEKLYELLKLYKWKRGRRMPSRTVNIRWKINFGQFNCKESLCFNTGATSDKKDRWSNRPKRGVI